MPSTKFSMQEQVRSRLNGGKEKEASWTDPREIMKAIEQVVNGMLRMDAFKMAQSDGKMTPDGLALATYTKIPVTTYMNTARAKMPAMPVRLEMNMGVYAIGPTDMDDTENILTGQFIPIPNGMTVMLKSQPMISDLLGQVGYESRGLDIIFDSDITKPPNNCTSVWMQLVVLDLAQYSDYDILPIPADMEADCVEAVYQRFSTEAGPDKIDDPIALTQKQPNLVRNVLLNR